jgi:cobalt-zinc-cadmium efflux system outer membrane protein
VGDLHRSTEYSLDQLLEGASRRQRLVSLARREEAARQRLALERAARYPDVTLGVFAGKEGPSNLRQDILGLSVALPLPVFRRNEAGVGRAMTELTQAQIDRQAAERDAAAGVRAQWQRVGQLETRAERLRQAVLPALEDNQRLSQIALREGEIGVAEVLLVNRQVAEPRRDTLDAEAELRRARIELERAAGWTPQTTKERK